MKIDSFLTIFIVSAVRVFSAHSTIFQIRLTDVLDSNKPLADDLGIALCRASRLDIVIENELDRQVNRQTDTQSCRQTGRSINSQSDKQADR